jgi:hypothetical protein
MSELNDPARIFDSDPRRAVTLLVEAQLQTVNSVIANQKLMHKFMQDRRLLEGLPPEIKNDPVDLAKMIVAFQNLLRTFEGYQIAVLSYGMLFIDRAKMLDLTNRYML